MRILVNISYQGSQFLGFQIQQQGRTVQQQFEKILKRMHRRHVRIHPSSRTDRGVHAYEQFFHFDTDLNIEPKQWKYAMNSALPDDIYVKEVQQVDDHFHCRYDCLGKRYRYKVYQATHRNPFESGLKTFIKEDASEVSTLLNEKNRDSVPFTAPAEGLYLEKIYLTEKDLTTDFGDNIKIHRKKSLQND